MTEYTLKDPILVRYEDGEPVIENMVAVLLLNEVIMLSSYWWKEEWSELAKQSTCIAVICNDCFCYASADAEEIELKDIPEVYSYWEKDKDWGTYVWCSRKRGMLPQKQLYDILVKSGWNLDAMGLDTNPTW